MSYTPTSSSSYPSGPGAYPYDSRRPSEAYPPQSAAARLPPILDQPPRYHASQQYSTFPTYGDMSRMYQSQTPPLPPPHARYDYRYSSLSGVPAHQPSFVAGPPPDREYPGQFKKRKLSSDISVYSLSAQNGPGEDGSSRIDGYLRNPATPNISTPSSTERPSAELQPARSRSQMTEQDKHELKKEKNREKQRRLRSRRAEQLNNLEHSNAEKDARLEHLETEVKRLESEVLQREDRWQRWVLELESRLAQARKRCQMLEAAGSSTREGEAQLDSSISREIADVRIRFGCAPRIVESADRHVSYPAMRSAENGTVDDRMSGMFHANVAMPSTERLPGSIHDAMSPLMIDPSVRCRSSLQDQYRKSASPLSVPAQLGPISRHPCSIPSPPSADTLNSDNTAVATPNDDNKSGQAKQMASDKPVEHSALHWEQVDPSISVPYMKMLHSMDGLPNYQSPHSDAVLSMETAPPAQSDSQTTYQQFSDSSLRSIENMSEPDILSLDNTSLLQLARSLIRDKLPPSMYTPQQGGWNTTMEQEQKSLSLRARNPSDASTLVDDNGSGPAFVRPAWRDTFTRSELYILYRALMFASNSAGSKEFFDGKRISELSPSQKEVYERWAAYEGRDKRVEMVPAMILRMRIILCDELQDRGDLDLTAYLCDTLHEAIIYGNSWSMYCWELPDAFWDRWSSIFPSGKEFCGALRAWRRKDGHLGVRPFDIIMATEARGARRQGGLELPPVGWAESLVVNMDCGVDKSAQSTPVPVLSAAHSAEQS